jgi:hypothetical protein
MYVFGPRKEIFFTLGGGEEKWYHTRIQFGGLLFVAAVMMYFDDNFSLVDCRW